MSNERTDLPDYYDGLSLEDIAHLEQKIGGIHQRIFESAVETGRLLISVKSKLVNYPEEVFESWAKSELNISQKLANRCVQIAHQYNEGKCTKHTDLSHFELRELATLWTSWASALTEKDDTNE